MLIEIDLDGYDTEEEMFEACKEFVYDQLNMTASGIKILWAEDPPKSPRPGKEDLERLKQQLGNLDKLAVMLKNDKEYLEQEAVLLPPYEWDDETQHILGCGHTMKGGC